MLAMAIFGVIALPLGQHVTLVGAARYWLLAMTFLSLIFADMSGSAVLDTAAIGSLVIPSEELKGLRI